MKTIISVFIAVLASMVLNFNVVQAEDQVVPGQAGVSEGSKNFNDHKTKIDPAREAKRMNYMRGQMALPPEPKTEDLTPASMNIEEKLSEPMEIKTPRRSHKVFRKQ